MTTTTPTVRVDDPGELAAGLPSLLGYRPRESVVLMALGGRSGWRVGLTARGDLPPEQHSRELAAMLAGRLVSDSPKRAMVFVVSESPDDDAFDDKAPDLPHRALVHELVLALDARGVPVHQALLVRSGRWWDFDCPEACCWPGAGTPLPPSVGEIEVAAVAAGTVVAEDRAALEKRIAPLGWVAAAGMHQTCLRVADDLVGRPLEEWTGEVARERIRSALERFRPGPVRERLTDEEVARLVCSLRDLSVRDWALQLSLGGDSSAAEELWAECTRRAPSPLDAAPATLLAISAWLRGDGAMANIAVDRALDSDPGYSMAGLVADGLAACIPPRQIRALLRGTAREAGTAAR